jgi:hypothetical protein
VLRLLKEKDQGGTLPPATGSLMKGRLKMPSASWLPLQKSAPVWNSGKELKTTSFTTGLLM